MRDHEESIKLICSQWPMVVHANQKLGCRHVTRANALIVCLNGEDSDQPVHSQSLYGGSKRFALFFK